MDATTQQITCTKGASVVNMDYSTGVLNATRGGFMNGHVYESASTGGNGQFAHQLPMNFDVAQFQVALNTTTPGELGSYFQPGGLIGRPFNGIVYITNTWQSSLQGWNNGLPNDPPPQGLQAPPNGGIAEPSTGFPTTPTTATHLQTSLPFELCSSTGAGGLAGQPFDSASPTNNGVFKIPSCAEYALNQVGGATPTGSNQARPTELRIFNGNNIGAVYLPSGPLVPPVNPVPNGLSIVSNLPTYVLGDFNTLSVPTSATANPWTPVMVAGDFISHLSNAWDDTNSPWNETNTYYARTASQTTYNVAHLMGHMSMAHNGAGTATAADLNNIMRYNENWANVEHIVNGSIVFGFTSVYFHYINSDSWPQCYSPPIRKWTYDPHLYSTINQPPGTPSFYVYSVENWHQ
jgi:hypothetical protein